MVKQTGEWPGTLVPGHSSLCAAPGEPAWLDEQVAVLDVREPEMHQLRVTYAEDRLHVSIVLHQLEQAPFSPALFDELREAIPYGVHLRRACIAELHE